MENDVEVVEKLRRALEALGSEEIASDSEFQAAFFELSKLSEQDFEREDEKVLFNKIQRDADHFANGVKLPDKLKFIKGSISSLHAKRKSRLATKSR